MVDDLYDPPYPPLGWEGEEIIVRRRPKESLGLWMDEECMTVQVQEGSPAHRAGIGRMLGRRLICIDDQVISVRENLTEAMAAIGKTPSIRLTFSGGKREKKQPPPFMRGYYWGTGVFHGYRPVSSVQEAQVLANASASSHRRKAAEARPPVSPVTYQNEGDARLWCTSPVCPQGGARAVSPPTAAAMKGRSTSRARR
eukprot:TRINITY_DN1709_c0_g1_i1.p1 TRINITY_DN1709_c0_g1~~TRINITY_DN1709_c0_g1_i1.p1  ORF type:complete len:198 (+),score=29.20 TRINITY_DN1709_c0_g1_i1:218-811(+)